MIIQLFATNSLLVAISYCTIYRKVRKVFHKVCQVFLNKEPAIIKTSATDSQILNIKEMSLLQQVLNFIKLILVRDKKNISLIISKISSWKLAKKTDISYIKELLPHNFSNEEHQSRA